MSIRAMILFWLAMAIAAGSAIAFIGAVVATIRGV
jgi:hypothetical protein